MYAMSQCHPAASLGFTPGQEETVTPGTAVQTAEPAPFELLPSPTFHTGLYGKLWANRSTVEKGAIVISGVALVGMMVWGLSHRKGRYKPNLSSAERARVKDAKPGSTVMVEGSRYKVGRIIDIEGGRRFGHKIPPKQYRSAGARRQADYGWPAGYKYPLVFRTKTGRIKPTLSKKRIRAAASYFGRHKHMYPLNVQATIASNINKAKKRFGIGGKPSKP